MSEFELVSDSHSNVISSIVKSFVMRSQYEGLVFALLHLHEASIHACCLSNSQVSPSPTYKRNVCMSVRGYECMSVWLRVRYERMI